MNELPTVAGAAPASPDDLAEACLAEACRLAGGLLDESRELPDGSLTWGRGAGHDGSAVEDSGPFNGRCGEALLFAALARATGRETYAEVALRILLTLRRGLPDPGYRRQLVGQLSFGIAGSGGLLYALLQIARWLEREDLLRLAAELSRELTRESIASDFRFDAVWGGAGAIPALLQLAALGEAGALDRAVAWGEHLMAQRVADGETGLRAWATTKKIATVGFAHGASGIANALLQLAAASGRRDFYRGALEAFDFERLMWHEASQNWRDSRAEPRPSMWSWCHGATGIGHARLAALDQLESGDEEGITRDLHRAITRSIAARVPETDTLCCGYLGRIDLLLEAARLLGNTSIEQQAHRLANERLARAREHGYVYTQGEEPPRNHLGIGLWQGTAGIAYFLLRLAAPETFPSVLRLASVPL